MPQERQLDIFEDPSAGDVGQRLLGLGTWPDQGRFPVNLPQRMVRDRVLEDIRASSSALIVTGYASLDQIIDLAASVPSDGRLRLQILLGNEPFPSHRKSFVHSPASFPDEVRDYWLERGVSLALSAKLILATDQLRSGALEARYIDDSRRPLHAKIYRAEGAVTIGSSNFTRAGLTSQLEGNVRFDRDADKRRYAEVTRIANYFWDVGSDYTKELLALFEQLLRLVTWQEALARACAELLEGEWAERYLRTQLDLGDTRLWPSQRAGIAQALWVLENIGSVLVADATGSGKTRMGAHLLRALRDRLWSTGRSRTDLSLLVCPPSVKPTWEHEALNCGLMLTIQSHGLLSQRKGEGYTQTSTAVKRAQTLAVDEAHNFLRRGSQRAQEVQANMADNVVLFTATPINRGPSDLLSLVDMLGADNMDDEALDVLEGLARRKGDVERNLGPADVAKLRSEIQRFTVRRTKQALNDLVDREPDAYVDAKGRHCRYPRHLPDAYDTGDSAHDRQHAAQIRETAEQLLGIALLEDHIEMPEALKEEGWDEEKFLAGRLTAIRHLALYNVMSTLRSSRAALVEHLVGTAEAMRRFSISDRVKQGNTGDTIGKLRRRASGDRPECAVSCPLPDWLGDADRFQAACRAEIQHYEGILRLVDEMSADREKTKAQLLCGLIERHKLVLAFDSHLISLEVIRQELRNAKVDAEVILATGTDASARRHVQKVLHRSSTARGIALCSDSMSEGVNLQGASAIVHLDMPSVVRVAEQRVGRVDRMDSPHEQIEAWWPNDAPEFAMRSDERFIQRYETVETLLGGNLKLPPDMASGSREPVTAQQLIAEAREQEAAPPWDGIEDAFSPVWDLIYGRSPMISVKDYRAYIGVQARVLSRIGLVSSDKPWAFFAVAGHKHGAPKWVLLDADGKQEPIVRLDRVCQALRERLSGDIQNLRMDERAVIVLNEFLVALRDVERMLLPKRKQRAIEQMKDVLESYRRAAEKGADLKLAARWEAIRQACSTAGEVRADLDVVAEQWLEAIRPVWAAKLRDPRKRRRPLLLRDIKRDLLKNPLSIDAVESRFREVPTVPPLDERIAACIIGLSSP